MKVQVLNKEYTVHHITGTTYADIYCGKEKVDTRHISLNCDYYPFFNKSEACNIVLRMLAEKNLK